jgi:hypothetical protein
MQLSRFPALAFGVLAAGVQVLVGLVGHLSPEQTGLINALVVAILGAATTWLVKGDAIVASLMGVAQALLALMLGFGLAIPPNSQATIMALVSALVAAFVHSQVTGPVPAEPGSSPLEPASVPPEPT